jgi:frataxin-like iron-binding protein CyaY
MSYIQDAIDRANNETLKTCVFDIRIAYENNSRIIAIKATSLQQAWLLAIEQANRMGTHHCESIKLIRHGE